VYWGFPEINSNLLPEIRVRGALQLLRKHYRYIRFAHVYEQVSTNSFVDSISGNSGVESLKGDLQLLMNGYRYIRFAHVHERVSTNSFVVWMIGTSSVESLRRFRLARVGLRVNP